MDANDAASYVQDLAGDNANIIFGAKYDESMTDEATITVIATGLENAAKTEEQDYAGSPLWKYNKRYKTGWNTWHQQTGGKSWRKCTGTYADTDGRTIIFWYSETASA